MHKRSFIVLDESALPRGIHGKRNIHLIEKYMSASYTAAFQTYQVTIKRRLILPTVELLSQ